MGASQKPIDRARGAEHVDSAKSAGLRYVRDTMPGIRRLGAPGEFSYVDAEGNPVTERARSKNLEI